MVFVQLKRMHNEILHDCWRFFFLKQLNLATWSILSTIVHFQFEQCYNLQRDIIDCISGDSVFFFFSKSSYRFSHKWIQYPILHWSNVIGWVYQLSVITQNDGIFESKSTNCQHHSFRVETKKKHTVKIIFWRWNMRQSIQWK